MSIADELVTRGWTQGALRNEHGAVCLWGAMLEAARTDELREWGVEAVRVVEELVGEPIVDWNDDPERTFDEVLRLAKEADALLEVDAL